jgi:2-phosphosulfolactate phosphatase
MGEQHRYQVRFDWGVGGAAAVAADADVLVWIDALVPRPAPLDELPAGPAVVETGLAGAVATAQWILDLQEARLQRTSVALVAAGAARGPGLRFAAEDLLAAGAVADALEARGIDAMSPEAAVADAAYRTLGRAASSLFAAVTGSGEPNPAGPVVRRPHPEQR